MNVIVAGEESGVTRDAFAALGHNAWSCDLKPSRRPGQHWQGSWREGANHHRPMAKLTDELVAEAKRLYASGVSQSEIGRRWGIHSSVISRAVRGESWGHVK